MENNIIYKKFAADDIVFGRSDKVSRGAFNGDVSTINQFCRNTAETTGSYPFFSKNAYYTTVYNGLTYNSSLVPEFSIAYGNYYGKGSVTSSAASLSGSGVSVSKAIYTQFSNSLLGVADSKFTFLTTGSAASGVDSDSIYIITFDNNRVKSKLVEGSLQFSLSVFSGSTELKHTFIDDSTWSSRNTSTSTKYGKVYNIISGSISNNGNGIQDRQWSPTGKYGYGLFYPDNGVIILNANALSDLFGSSSISNPNLAGDLNHNVEKRNFLRLFDAIKNGGSFSVNNLEYVPTTQYFVRIKNQEFNYSNNPTFISGSDGEFLFSEFQYDPRVYLTSVGLYNDNNELVAVAKVSKPILKSFDSEALLKVKLQY